MPNAECRMPNMSTIHVASAFRRKIELRRKATIALLLLLCVPVARADVIDRIMAVVGGQPITFSDVTAAQQFHLIDVPPGTPDPIPFIVDRLIERTLVLAEVERFQPPEPDPTEMTIRIDALERRAGSTAAFDTLLAVTGMTRDQLRRYLRDDLRIATYLNQRFGANTDPNERQAATKTWISELRKRADVTVLTLIR
jgi:peptidyl-prolyl cis-trans isomerase SurA